MALPHEHCAPGNVCCTSLFDAAANLLEIAHTAVVGCSFTECALPELVGYISMGARIEDPQADYLVVSLQAISPTAGDRSGNMHLPLYRATFQVKLLETGWPMPHGDDEQIIIPDPDLVSNVARHSYAHGEAMYRALANALARKELNPSCNDCYQTIAPLTPIEPSGGTTGWLTTVTLGTNFGSRM